MMPTAPAKAEKTQARTDKGDAVTLDASPSSAPPCGIRLACTSREGSEEAAAALASGLGPLDGIGFVLVFVSPHYDADAIVEALGRHLTGPTVAGCSTSGEIGFDGLTEGNLVALAFPRETFRIVCEPLPPDPEFGLERGGAVVTEARRRLEASPGAEGGEVFALTLLDGLCQREEIILSALQRALGDVPQVGGSSGDDLAFQDTFVFADGRMMRGAGLLLLVRTTRPFRLFKTDHFEPTATKLVVTACDPDNRVVTELDAEPARIALARAIGLSPEALCGLDFAAHPLLVRVGGEHYCRSIQKMNADGSLSFYCAIDTGVVLTVAETGDMVASLEATLSGLDADLGGIDFVLGFDCVHRRLEAEARGVADAISALLRRFRVFGFNTYGEQYDAMHLNHTFTGVAFGRDGGPR